LLTPVDTTESVPHGKLEMRPVATPQAGR